MQAARPVSLAHENVPASRQVEELNRRLARENLYLADKTRGTCLFKEIIGDSLGLLSVLRQVETVAPLDSTVLICGQTGTGKERFGTSRESLRRMNKPQGHARSAVRVVVPGSSQAMLASECCYGPGTAGVVSRALPELPQSRSQPRAHPGHGQDNREAREKWRPASHGLTGVLNGNFGN